MPWPALTWTLAYISVTQRYIITQLNYTTIRSCKIHESPPPLTNQLSAHVNIWYKQRHITFTISSFHCLFLAWRHSSSQPIRVRRETTEAESDTERDLLGVFFKQSKLQIYGERNSRLSGLDNLFSPICSPYKVGNINYIQSKTLFDFQRLAQWDAQKKTLFSLCLVSKWVLY